MSDVLALQVLEPETSTSAIPIPCSGISILCSTETQ